MSIRLPALLGACFSFVFSFSVHAESISGNIDSDFGIPAFSEIQAFDASGNFVANTVADESGDYTLNLPGAGDYYVYMPWWSLTERRVVAEAWTSVGGAACINCDVLTTGEAITVGAGEDIGGIDFFLEEGAQATGMIVISGTSDPLHPVIIDLKSATGEHLGGIWNNPDGSYELHAVPPGDYKLLFMGTGDAEPYLDKLNDGTLCQNGSCDLSTTGATTPLITGNNTINADLARGWVISGSVTNDYGFPLPWAHVEILDTSGASMGFINAEEDEFWEIPVPVPVSPPVTYYAQVLSWSMPNLTPEVWDNIPCDPCDPLSVTPTPIEVSAGDIGGIDFVISGIGHRIVGNVQDSSATNLEGVEVCAAKVVHQLTIGCATTDVNGNYAIEGLQDIADDITAYIAHPGPHAVLKEMWGGPAGECCNFDQAQTIDMSGGDAFGINFALQGGNRVEGTLSAGGSPVVNEGSVSVFDPSGNWVDGIGVGAGGEWSLVLPDGDYHFYFEAWGAFEHYVSEFQNDETCPGQRCYFFNWPAHITPLTVDGSWTNPLNADLEHGVIFQGSLTDELPPNDPIDRLRIFFYDNDLFDSTGGATLQSFIFMMRGDVTGSYRTPALPVRNYLPFSSGYDLGYGREYYDNQKCDPVDCDDALNNRTIIQAGVDYVAGGTVTVDFDLIRRVTLSGNVSDGGGPLGGIRIRIWDTKGNLLEETWSDGGGNWFAENVDGNGIPRGFPAADYYITANGEDSGFIAQAYSAAGNADCPQEFCVQGGTPPVAPTSLNGNDLINVNFVLNGQSFAHISGTLLRSSDGGPVGGVVQVFNGLDQHVTDAWVWDDSGYWETNDLPDGIYFLRTNYIWDRFINDLWDGGDGVQCAALLCDLITGEAVVISAGVVTSGGALVPNDKTIDIRVDEFPDGTGGQISGELLNDNLPPGSNGINFAGVLVFNADGNYVTESRTQPDGSYITRPLPDGDYHLLTHYEPDGLLRELYNGGEANDDVNEDVNTVCDPHWSCDPPEFITDPAFSTAITIAGGDFTTATFVLKSPTSGGAISGTVYDAVLEDGITPERDFPLPDVWLTLFQFDGDSWYNWNGSAVTDPSGRFTFAGLPDGQYKIMADGPPEDYNQSSYGEAGCCEPNDPDYHGAVITITGGVADVVDADIALDYVGAARIVGTVTRTGGEPISSHVGGIGIVLHGDGGGSWGTNAAGQYQILLNPGTYRLSTEADTQNFNLINEVWTSGGGIPCFDDCGPYSIGGEDIDLTGGGTAQADFELDTGTIIEGTVFNFDGTLTVPGVEVCVERLLDGWWAACTNSDGSGYYQLKGLEARSDWRVFVNWTNGQPYLPNDSGDNPVTTSAAGPANADIYLDDGYFISGYVTDFDTGLPVEGLGVCIHYSWGDWTGVCGGTDVDGFYRTGEPLPAGGDYVAYANGVDFGYRLQMWEALNCNGWCDFSQGTPIELGNSSGPTGVNAEYVDFALELGVQISGRVTEASTGLGLAPAWSTGEVRIYDSTGAYVASAGIGNDGQYGITLPASVSDYYVLASNYDGPRIDELWNGPTNPGTHCPRLSCDYATQGVAISGAGGTMAANVDIEMDEGSRILGTVTTNGETPPSGTFLFLYDAATGKYAGAALTGRWSPDGYIDGTQTFDSAHGYPAGGSYVLSNRFVIDGNDNGFNPEYLPTMYLDSSPDGLGCGYPCDILAGGSVINIIGSDDTDITADAYNFVSEPQVAITGTLLAIDGAEVGGAVRVFDVNGNNIADAWVQDEFGNWATEPLDSGTYYLATGYTWADVIDDRWDDADGSQCLNLTCDLLGGTPIVIQGGTATSNGVAKSINFRLDYIPGGGRINGRLMDEVGNGLGYAVVEILNRDGNYVSSARADAAGYYLTPLLANDDYYLRTSNEPDGRSRELYRDPGDAVGSPSTNYTCPWAPDCSDPNVVIENGGAIQILDGDYDDANFVLEVPATGGRISGQVFDQAVANLGDSFALPDVYLVLFDSNGNWLTETVTDLQGNYTFAGLPDDAYQVFTSGVPEGYAQECYENVPCDWGTDFSISGASLLNITGGSYVAGVDIGLDYSGTRIVGTVTRSDNGQPVLSNDGWISVDAYDDLGNGQGGSGTNLAGQYQIHLPGPGRYQLSTGHDVDTHNLVNEAWNSGTGAQCFGDCNPFNVIGSEVIDLTSGGSFTADFELDPAAEIVGTVTEEGIGTPLGGITMCLAPQVGNPWYACRDTAEDGTYAFRGLNGGSDYVPFVWNVNGQGYARETWQDKPCCDAGWIGNGDAITVALGGSVTADFALAPAAAITGLVTDSATGTPIGNVPVWLVTPACDFIERGNSDGSGRYTLSGFDPGTYYVAAQADGQGYVRQLYPDVKRYDACAPDIADGQAIPVDPLAVINNVDLALDMGGSISGYISDASGVLPQNSADVRLYDEAGNIAGFNRNREADGGYTVGGLLPGTYTVLLTGRNQGLIDERYDDVPCPRNACDPALGVPVVVTPEENVTGVDATLAPGARLSGRITDVSGPVANYFVDFYTLDGLYAGYGRTDADGNFTSVTGFPDGEYLMSNQWFPTPGNPEPVAGGYLPQVWKADGSFGECGDPCNLLLGDPITISGGADVAGLDMLFATGTRLSGAVTSGATPLAGVEMRLLSSVDGSLARSTTTDGSGNYAFDGLPSTGQYFLRTLNSAGYGDLLFDTPTDDSCNPSCDPLLGGLIAMTTDQVIDFDLVPTPVIQGQVTLPVTGNPAPGVSIKAYNNLGSVVASTLTDASGNYTLANLWSGTFYVRSHNTAGYLDDLWSNTECGAACDVLDGTPVNLTASGAAGINLQLRSAAVISGTVTDGAVPLPGVTVQLYRDTGAFVKSVISNAAGTYSLNGLSAGNYHLVTRNTFGYVDEGAGGETCQSTCAPTSTTVVNVPANASVVRNFALDYGGEISGNVQGGGSPLVGVSVRAFNSAGVQIASTTTNASGNYLIRGLVGGNVYLRTANAAPYRNQRYDGLACDTFCDVLAGTAVAVTLGGTSSGIDFVLEAGYSISGNVTNADTGSGIPGVRVDAFDGAGLLAGTAVAATGGAFEIDGLPNGDYRLKTANAFNYIDRVLGGDTCTPEPCEIGTGSLNVVSGADIGGVSIALSTGNTTGGYVTDTDSNPLQTGAAWLYSATGAFLKTAAINDGLFSFNGLADGSYRLLVKNDLGLVDQLWEGIDCPDGSCDITAGTPIDVGAAPAAPAGAPSSLESGRLKIKLESSHSGESRIRFGLPRGTRISGNVSSDAGAVQFVNVYIFDADGDVAAVAVTDGLGNFETASGLPAGNWYVATQAPGQPGAGNGLIDEVFDDLQCLGDCDPVGLGTLVSTPNPDPVSIVLDRGDAPITGTVSAAADATPLGQVTVEVYDTLGALVKQVSTNGSGVYSIDGLPGGNYTLVAKATAGNYGAILYDGLYCDGGCDPTDSRATPVQPGGTADFFLPDDNCPNVDNPAQEDSDRNGRGDACELPVIDDRADVDPTVQMGVGSEIVRGAIVHANVKIGKQVLISRNAEIGARCRIGDRVTIGQNTTVGADCRIGDDSTLDRESVYGVNLIVGTGSYIGKNAEVGSNVTIGDGVNIDRNVFIADGVCVPAGANYGKDEVITDLNLCD